MCVCVCVCVCVWVWVWVCVYRCVLFVCLLACLFPYQNVSCLDNRIIVDRKRKKGKRPVIDLEYKK